VAAPVPRAPGRGVRIGAGVLTAIGLGALGAAIGVDVAGRQSYDALAGSCAPSCSDASIERLRLSEAAAIGLYAAAGATLSTSLVLFSIELARSRHRR
jgi:hypothetical protein